MFYNFFFPVNRTFYETMWKYTIELDRPQMTIWRMRIACWIPKAKNTHSECVLLAWLGPLSQYTWELHCNNGCTNMPECYVIHVLPVLSVNFRHQEMQFRPTGYTTMEFMYLITIGNLHKISPLWPISHAKWQSLNIAVIYSRMWCCVTGWNLN